MNKFLKKSIAVLSAMAMAVTTFTGTAVFAESEPDLYIDIDQLYVEEGLTSAFSSTILNNSLKDGKVDLKPGNYEKWIDRIDVPSSAVDFYHNMEEWADNDGINDYFIDESKIASLKTVRFSDGSTAKYIKAFDYTSSYDYALQVFLTTFAAFDRDHPEVFWLDGRVSWFPNNGTFYMVLKGVSGYDYDVREATYTSKTKIKRDIALRDKCVSSIVSKASGSEYETVKYFNDVLTHTNSYNSYVAAGRDDDAYRLAWECLSALDGRVGAKGPVCEAYSRAMKVLCDKVGIHCVLVDGDAGGAHMWNNIQVDGNWYLVDSTWNDPYTPNAVAVSGLEHENYLLIGSKSSLLTKRTVVNRMFTSSIGFTNGPVLSPTDYVPSNTPSTIKSIEVTKQPTKKSYTEGDTFDPTGLEIKAVNTDGTSKTVAYSSSTKADFKFSPSTLSVNDTKVTVTYKGKSAVISGITVAKKAGKTYKVTFKANNGTTAKEVRDVPAGKYELPGQIFDAPTGKKFAGWSTTSKGKVITSYTIRRNTNFYAIWEVDDSEEIEDPDHKHTIRWSSNINYHWGICTDCGIELDREKHIFDEGVITRKPTATRTGIKTYTCTVCGRVRRVTLPKGSGDEEPDPSDPDHEHNIKWSSNLNYHWGTCTDCGAVTEREKHSFDEGVITRKPTTTRTGIMTYTCKVCGRVRRVTIPKLTADDEVVEE